MPLAGLAYTGSLVKVRFRAESGGAGTDFYLDQLVDDVCFNDPPTCPDPTAFVLNSINSSSADFGWTDNAGAASWGLSMVYLDLRRVREQVLSLPQIPTH